MQTSNRDNLGRNNYWTPSNISLTQSLINEAINEINSKISYINEILNLKADEIDVVNEISSINNKLDLKSDLSYVDSNISTLNSSIQLKANTIDVDNKLLLKSDLDYVNSNISSINNNLDLKANTIDVDNKLSEKADLLETNNKLDLKANLSDVYVKNDIDDKVSTLNSEINLKANIIDVDNKLDLKSDLTYVDSNISTINSNIQLKANTNDVYNKTEIDEKLSNFNPSASVYTKEEIDEKLLDYPTKDTVYDKDYINSYYYRQAQVDAIFMSKDRNLIIAREQPSDVTTYTSLASQELLAKKANVDDVYNKTEIDSKISTINSNIDLKANTSDVYNKTECDSRYIAVGSISKNMEVYSRINLVNILDPLVSTKTSFTAYSSQRLFTITIPAESNVSLPENNGITLWHLKFVLFITSTTTDKERLKELMMNLRLSVYINNAHHELSVKPQYYNDLTRYYLDSTFILNSLPTSDETLYIDGLTTISMNDLQIEFRNIYPYTNYIYRFGLLL